LCGVLNLGSLTLELMSLSGENLPPGLLVRTFFALGHFNISRCGGAVPDSELQSLINVCHTSSVTYALAFCCASTTLVTSPITDKKTVIIVILVISHFSSPIKKSIGSGGLQRFPALAQNYQT
jgi:hypothetical protein